MTAARPRIAILGLGEAGLTFATDLGAHAEVTGYDPLWTGQPQDFAVADSARDAVTEADIILAFTAAPDATGALDSVLGIARSGALYADFSSSSPALKTRLAAAAEEAELSFVDAVLLAPVLQARVQTPVLASGPGAQPFAVALSPLGMSITTLGSEPGEAAARKLLRSIVVKGLTALLVEALRSAEDEDMLEWFSEHIAQTLSDITPEFLAKLLDGTLVHSTRRIHEMTAAVEMIESRHGNAAMTRAIVEVLSSIGSDRGLPRGEALR